MGMQGIIIQGLSSPFTTNIIFICNFRANIAFYGCSKSFPVVFLPSRSCESSVHSTIAREKRVWALGIGSLAYLMGLYNVLERVDLVDVDVHLVLGHEIPSSFAYVSNSSRVVR